MCSTCGQLAAPCEDVPGVYPEPLPPAPVPGCSCEPDGEAAARVSLDCFCSFYEGTATRGLAGGSCSELGSYDRAATDACGRIWFETGQVNSVRLGYDRMTGALVSAVASNGGPVTAPCNTFQVRAGSVEECDTVDTCDCYDQGRGSCFDEVWFY
jgi:hypothetical protein